MVFFSFKVISYREVTTLEASSLARRLGVPFLEASAAEDCESVRVLFQEAVRSGLIVQAR